MNVTEGGLGLAENLGGKYTTKLDDFGNEEKAVEQIELLKPLENKEELGKFDKDKTFLERLQRKTDKFVVSARELSSRGTSFLIAMLGVVLQASHTALLMYDISGFSSIILKVLVSVGLGVFISSALAIFTIKSDGKNKQILNIINIFFYFEVFTNLFYYFNSLIFSHVDKNFSFAAVDSRNWLYLVVAVPFAYIVPFSIKQFSGIISADEKLQFGSVEGPQEVLVDLTGDQLETINDSSTKINQLTQTIENMKFQIDTLKDYSEEVRNVKGDLSKNYLKKGETLVVDIDGKKSSITIK